MMDHDSTSEACHSRWPKAPAPYRNATLMATEFTIASMTLMLGPLCWIDTGIG